MAPFRPRLQSGDDRVIEFDTHLVPPSRFLTLPRLRSGQRGLAYSAEDPRTLSTDKAALVDAPYSRVPALLFSEDLDRAPAPRDSPRGRLTSDVDVGIILWCLSVSANEWQSPTCLSRLCTIPINGVLDKYRDTSSYEAQVLRPRQWFGLPEHKEQKEDAGDPLLIGKRRCSTASFRSKFGSNAPTPPDTEAAPQTAAIQILRIRSGSKRAQLTHWPPAIQRCR
jgi:hypothetical protein